MPHIEDGFMVILNLLAAPHLELALLRQNPRPRLGSRPPEQARGAQLPTVVVGPFAWRLTPRIRAHVGLLRVGRQRLLKLRLRLSLWLHLQWSWCAPVAAASKFVVVLGVLQVKPSAEAAATPTKVGCVFGARQRRSMAYAAAYPWHFSGR